jgi:ABC-type uncharacterized transport system YnjBCD ATPase subunit
MGTTLLDVDPTGFMKMANPTFVMDTSEILTSMRPSGSLCSSLMALPPGLNVHDGRAQKAYRLR